MVRLSATLFSVIKQQHYKWSYASRRLHGSEENLKDGYMPAMLYVSEC